MGSHEDLLRKRALLTPEQRVALERRLRAGIQPRAAHSRADEARDVRTLLGSWNERDGTGVELPWELLVEAGRTAAPFPAGLEEMSFAALSPALNALTAAYVCEALIELDAFSRPDTRWSVEDLLRERGVLPTYRKLLSLWLAMLEELGLLVAEGDGYSAPAPLPAGGSEAAATALSRRAAGTVYEHIVASMRSAGRSLASILRGEKHALEDFFAGGSSRVVDVAYGETPEARYCIDTIAGILAVAGRSAGEGKQLRVLELGAGVGATTAKVLPVLPAETAYLFTDISTYFLEHGRERFGADRVSTALLNIDDDPVQAGYPPASFDVVLASNVFHCARLLARSLGHARTLLRPGGALVLMEATHNEHWHLMTMGLLKGFLSFEDYRLRERRPLLSRAAWEEMLHRAGFGRVASFPGEPAAGDLIGQHVLLACS
jgi:SAM-dependent methyltransferase